MRNAPSLWEGWGVGKYVVILLSEKKFFRPAMTKSVSREV